MFLEPLNLTIQTFKLTAKGIAKASGVGESTISHFRHGNIDIKLSTLESIVHGLPTDARKYFLFNALMPQLDQDDIGTLLILIASHIRNETEKTSVEKVLAVV